MKNVTQMQTNSRLRELVIPRIFDAQRPLVWQAWTDVEHLKKWWGPKVFTTPYFKIDFRIGGEYLSAMRSPDGKDFWSKGYYREIVLNERLVMSDSFADAQGNIVQASYYGLSPAFPREALVTVTFDDYDRSKTKMVLTYSGVPEEDLDNARTGWVESFDKLSEYLRLLKNGKYRS